MALSPHRAMPFSLALALTMPAAQALAPQWVAPPIRTMPGTTIGLTPPPAPAAPPAGSLAPPPAAPDPASPPPGL